MDYTIQRQDSVSTVCATYQEIEMIEAATLRWSGAEDLPDGVEFARLDFGGVKFKVFRNTGAASQAPVRGNE
jgi:hypothetical protein